MKIIPTFSKRTYVFSGTFLALLAMFVLYFLFYLPQREERFIKQRERALHQMARNFEIKSMVWSKNAERKFTQNQTNLLEKEDLEKMIYQVDLVYDRNSQDPLLALKTNLDSLLSQVQEFERSKQINEEGKEGIEKEADTSLINKVKDLKNEINKLKEIKEKGSVDTTAFRDSLTKRLTEFKEILKKRKGEVKQRMDKEKLNSFLSFVSQGGKEPEGKDKITFHQADNIKVLTENASFFTFSNKNKTEFQAFVLMKEEAWEPSYQTTPGSLFLKTENSDSEKEEAEAKFQLVKKGVAFGQVEDARLGLADYKLFSTSFTLSREKTKETWYLYGLVSLEEYAKAKRAIPSILIVVYGGLLLLFLFSMPLLKTLFMSRVERLHHYNIIQIAVSFVLTFSLLVLGLLSLDAYLIDNRNKVETDLQAISTHVADDFKKELDAIRKQMAVLNQQLSGVGEKGSSVSIYKAVKKPDLSHYPYFNYIFWMNGQGDVQYEFTGIKSENEKLKEENYAERPYFKLIRENKGWHGPSAETGSSQFYLQSIVSWTSGEPTAIVSMPYKGEKENMAEVVALNTPLYSLMDPVLPPGYEFHVVDQDGTVLFSSDKENNLQQNLLQESEMNKGLTGTLISKTSAILDLPYNNKNYQAFAQPLPGTP